MTRKKVVNTPDTVGNQFGYLCPACKGGDELSVEITVQAKLYPNGTDIEGQDHEFDEISAFSCGCGWHGQGKDLLQAENFEDSE